MKIALLGAAFSAGGADPGCRRGPLDFQQHAWKKLRNRLPLRARWAGIVRESSQLAEHYPALHTVGSSSRRLARQTRRLRQGGELPVVIGGDHSSAIGTWSGIAGARGQAMGLLWIDAHLDSHTPDTSASQRLHGMPLATLLGEGIPALTKLAGMRPVIDPRYCVVIGARSYESGEPLRLKRLGVRFHTRQEIRQRGLPDVLREAWRHVSACPQGFGVSLDLDVLDPLQAAGVSVPEQDGLHPQQLARLLAMQGRKHRLRGLELVELNPRLDFRGETRRALGQLLQALLAR